MCTTVTLTTGFPRGRLRGFDAGFRARAKSRLLDGMAERDRVLADTGVSRDNGEQGRRFTHQLQRGQMHGIERPDGLRGESTCGTGKHVFGHVDDETPAPESLNGPDRRPLLDVREASSDPRPEDAAIHLREGQRRRDELSVWTKRSPCRDVALQ